MDLRFVEETDPLRQALLEIYVWSCSEQNTTTSIHIEQRDEPMRYWQVQDTDTLAAPSTHRLTA